MIEAKIPTDSTELFRLGKRYFEQALVPFVHEGPKLYLRGTAQWKGAQSLTIELDHKDRKGAPITDEHGAELPWPSANGVGVKGSLHLFHLDHLRELHAVLGDRDSSYNPNGWEAKRAEREDTLPWVVWLESLSRADAFLTDATDAMRERIRRAVPFIVEQAIADEWALECGERWRLLEDVRYAMDEADKANKKAREARKVRTSAMDKLRSHIRTAGVLDLGGR